MDFFKRLKSVYKNYGLKKTIIKAYWKMIENREIEEHKSFGPLNDNKVFYIIRMSKVHSSLGPILVHVLLNLKKCDINGYIPVIDLRHFENTLQEFNEVHKINTWMYFFDQPTFWGTDAAYHSKNVILGDPFFLKEFSLPEKLYNYFFNNISDYCELFQKYIHINGRLRKKFTYIDEMMNEKGRVLGVSYRGTGYRNLKIVNEARQPSLADEIRDASELMKKWECEKIYLMTEDTGALEAFRNEFGNKLLYIERKQRFSSDTVDTYTNRFNMDHEIYHRAEEYLAEMYALSRCHCLLAPRAGYLIPVLCMNNESYLHTYIYDLGYYTEDDYK